MEALANQPRQGAELVRASQEFAQEDIAKSWRLFGVPLALWGAAVTGALLFPWIWAQALSGLFAGLLSVRMFIFYHDYLHGAIFRGSTWGKWVMSAVGMYTLNPPAVWRETHDYHHRNNAKMVGASIGSFPVLTTTMWKDLSTMNRIKYRIARNPLTIFAGYFTIFVLGMCLSAFRRDPKNHWLGPVALLMHLGAFAAVWSTLGLASALFAVTLPPFIATGAGSYLFYAQHNFPSIQLKSRQEWEYSFAALRSSSMFDMSPLMHWFTGNIGYHHVHHLNHRIPFYRLPEAMEHIPELQDPGRTSWHPKDVWGCLRLKLWNDEEKRMVGWP